MFKENKNRISYPNYTIEEFIEKIKNKEIVIPDIQRDLVWKEEMKVNFLTTIERKYPYGSIILAKSHNDSKIYILDGLQRTTTLISIWQNCYRYTNDEYKELLFEYFFEKIREKIDDNEILNLDNEFIKRTIKNAFDKNFNEWKKQTYIDPKDFECSFDFENIKHKSQQLVASFRDTYIYFRDQRLGFNNQLIYTQFFSGDDSDVAEIFQRINEQGVSLSDIEILKAKLSINKINQDNFPNIVKEIKIFKSKHQFESLIKNFKDIEVSANDDISYFDVFYYVVFSPLEELFCSISDLDYFANLFKRKKPIGDWFKIVKFIIFSYKDNDLHQSEDLSLNIRIFFEKYKDEREFIRIREILKESISDINNILRFPIFFDINNEKISRNCKWMSVTELLLVIGLLFNAKINNININKKAILKNLFVSTINNLFSSSSTKNAIDCLKRDTFFNDIPVKTLINLLISDFKNKKSIFMVSKILTPLILLENNIENAEGRYCKLFKDEIFINFSQQREYYENSIYNYIIFFNDNKYKNMNRKKMQVDDLRGDYFNKNCNNRMLVEEYIELNKNFFNSINVKKEDVEKIYDLRKKIIIEFLKGKI